MERDGSNSPKISNVLSFRRRAAVSSAPRTSVPLSPTRPPVDDVGKYERVGDGDDYRHRMLTNALGLAICTLLVLTGVWIANKMADIRRDQDCVLAGRRNCAQLQIPGPER
jgi:hypothetical protein